jgi:cell division protein FtsW (lipid II flippase)
MSVKDWFLTMLITYIPLVGLVMLFVWAFDSNTNLNKKNFAKASLLWMLVGIALAIIIVVLFMGAFLTLLGTSGE